MKNSFLENIVTFLKIGSTGLFLCTNLGCNPLGFTASNLSETSQASTAASDLVSWSNSLTEMNDTNCSKLSALANTNKDASEALQKCLIEGKGKTLALNPGVYLISKTIYVEGPVNVITKGKKLTDPGCQPTSQDCVQFKAALNVAQPQNQGRRGYFHLTGSNILLSHLIFNGDRENRTSSQNNQNCRSGDNSQGLGITALVSNSVITNSVLTNMICGTSFEVHDGTKGLKFTNNIIAKNGRHYLTNLWADGLTVHNARDSEFSNNKFIDNTDIQMIFGGCQNCQITANIFRHTTEDQGSSFGDIMIHAWPGNAGDYTNTLISKNDVDCGPKRLCGYGLLVGGDSWYMDTKVKFGNVTENSIKRAMIGISVDEVTGLFNIKDNHISDILDGEFYCQNNPTKTARTSIYNVSPKSFTLLTSESQTFFKALKATLPERSVTQRDYDLCIPQPPYIWSKEFISTPARSESEITKAITNVYQMGLSRAPDTEGLLFYENRYIAVGLAQVEKEILNSPEAKNSLWKLSASDFIEKIYQAVLGRSPDTAGRSYWRGKLSSGAFTKEQFIDSLLTSEEFKILFQKKGLKN